MKGGSQVQLEVWLSGEELGSEEMAATVGL